MCDGVDEKRSTESSHCSIYVASGCVLGWRRLPEIEGTRESECVTPLVNEESQHHIILVVVGSKERHSTAFQDARQPNTAARRLEGTTVKRGP